MSTDDPLISALENVIRIDPTKFGYPIQLAELYLKRDDPANALAHAQAILAQSQTS